MGFIWFWFIAAMLAAYVVLDGFDLGVGILHPWLGRSENDKQLLFRSIGPVWDGNEVWLIAGGGTLYFAFPLLYASAFSGFYLALMIVLWLLILRGASIELRSFMHIGVWRTFFDGLFFFSSFLLTIFFGAALANVIRGVPLGADGYFFLPLWTNWLPGADPGILDWYTVLGGLLALVALLVHGAFYVAVKTVGDLQLRARKITRQLWAVLFVLTGLDLYASVNVRPDILDHYRASPISFLVPVFVGLSLLGMFFFTRKNQDHKNNDRKAFTCSCIYLSAMLVGAAAALYPRLLPSITNPALDITVEKALSGPHALRVGLIWWSFGMCMAVLYFVIVYRMFRGKVSLEDGGYGH
jgi:cytochrome bd ubiquinol oxidase subunit II